MTLALSLAHAPRRHEASALPRSLLLAVLLHVWLALLVGNRPGVDRPGVGLWGGLHVTLLGTPQAPGDGPRPETATRWRDDGPPGPARTPRHGGQVRRPEAPAPTPPEPGAQALGRWQAEPTLRTLQDLEEPTAPVRPSEHTSLPTSERPAGADRLSADTARADWAVPVPTAPSARELPAHLVVPAARADAPALTRQPPLEKLSPTAPLAAELPVAPAPPLLPEPGPSVRTLATPPSLREPPLSAPVAAPMSAIVPAVRADDEERVRPLPAPSWPRQLEAPVPPTRRPPPLPAIPTLPALEDEPPLRAPPGTAPALPTPSDADAATSRPETSRPSPSPSPSPAPSGSPAAVPAPAPSGAPWAGARVGHDVATAPSASASAPLPPLNLQRPRAGQGPTRSGPGLLEWLPAPPERKSKLEKSLDDASRADCRTAHGAQGLLAAGSLLADAARGKGCKW